MSLKKSLSNTNLAHLLEYTNGRWPSHIWSSFPILSHREDVSMTVTIATNVVQTEIEVGFPNKVLIWIFFVGEQCDFYCNLAQMNLRYIDKIKNNMVNILYTLILASLSLCISDKMLIIFCKWSYTSTSFYCIKRKTCWINVFKCRANNSNSDSPFCHRWWMPCRTSFTYTICSFLAHPCVDAFF